MNTERFIDVGEEDELPLAQIDPSAVCDECREKGDCCYGWCHDCGAVVKDDEWERNEPEGLNRCPACGDEWPNPMCLCDVVGPEAREVYERQGDPRIPA